MDNQDVLDRLTGLFKSHFARRHQSVAYAPGRAEILGNHTDYNEGFVLSAALNLGTFFMAAPSGSSLCRIVAADVGEEVAFDSRTPAPVRNGCWANYVKGVFAGLQSHADVPEGFLGMFLGNLPIGSGLSSSAALEISAGLALADLYGIRVPKLELARIGQAAEHKYAGVRCGLMDQISSLFGVANGLVLSDFRHMQISSTPLGPSACFLMCNTRVKHALVDGEYNERRGKCEEAAQYFASVLDHPVTALRDVSWEEWQRHAPAMDPSTAKRAAHIIGENERVLAGRHLLETGEIEGFGRLMFESHRSSQTNFDNSCTELDLIVETASRTQGVLGARLSGGGFGGSAVVLVRRHDAESVGGALADGYQRKFEAPCEVRVIIPSDGAAVIG